MYVFKNVNLREFNSKPGTEYLHEKRVQHHYMYKRPMLDVRLVTVMEGWQCSKMMHIFHLLEIAMGGSEEEEEEVGDFFHGIVYVYFIFPNA